MKNKINFKKKLSIFISFFLSIFLFSCQSNEIFEEVNFDNNLFSNIYINAEQKIINADYDISYSEPYIDHTLAISSLERISHWLENNINTFGTQNKLLIDIVNSSIVRTEQDVEEKKKFSEQTEYFYEIHYLVNFKLYDDDNFIIANTKTEVKRTTTSSKFISLNERDNIINTLILKALIDVSLKSEELLKKHMEGYIL